MLNRVHEPDTNAKNLFTNNPDFYPTPYKLICEMWHKVDSKNISFVLEPSAGTGAIADYLKDKRSLHIKVIEKDPNLRALLTGKGWDVIDSDFLTYSGSDSFDLIIMNPPFSEGEHHLLKAIRTIYSGQIICLLNAETLKNPYTNFRKDLVRQLEELNADIEYIPNAFESAVRSTQVEVAMVYIDKRIAINKILSDGLTDSEIEEQEIENQKAVVSAKPIEFLVEDYNHTIDSGMTVLKKYYQEHGFISNYIFISSQQSDSANRKIHWPSNMDLNQKLNFSINSFVESVRKSFWEKTLKLEEVRARMTEKKRKEFYEVIQKQCAFDFTETNIRQFIGNLIGDYEGILSEATAEIFDKMTHKHHWNSESDKNIHYFNGWKTNSAFMVKEKVIIPLHAGYGSPFRDFGGWRLDYKAVGELDDIDIVMNYFDGGKEYIRTSSAIHDAFKTGNSTGIKSIYFICTCHKKGTIHMRFNSEDIRRRFNICAGKYKNWLPPSYGTKSYCEMDVEEQAIVESFEGKAKYIKNIGLVGFSVSPNVVMLENKKAAA